MVDCVGSDRMSRSMYVVMFCQHLVNVSISCSNMSRSSVQFSSLVNRWKRWPKNGRKLCLFTALRPVLTKKV